MVVDFHVHCFPDNLARVAIPRLAAAGGIEPHLDGTASDLRRSMQEAGISLSVVQPVATKPQQVRKINAWAAEQNAIRRSGGQPGQLLFFGSLHPLLKDWREEIGRIKSDGLRGIKLHPEYQSFYVDDEGMWPVYEAVLQEGLIILFHAGEDIGIPPPVHCTPERLARIMRRFPGGRIVAAHMGGFRCWEDVARHLVGQDIYFDTSFSLRELGAGGMSRLIRDHGADKVLFGSDSPWTSQRGELVDLRKLDLPPGDLERILCRNAISLLGMSTKPGGHEP
jgi:predicted TIM-barrel fold metal-dependent hydrolase